MPKLQELWRKLISRPHAEEDEPVSGPRSLWAPSYALMDSHGQEREEAFNDVVQSNRTGNRAARILVAGTSTSLHDAIEAATKDEEPGVPPLDTGSQT